MSKFKGGLGKGLSALIPTVNKPAIQPNARDQRDQEKEAGFAADHQPGITVEKNQTGLTGSISDLELFRIKPNPFQPRADFDQEALDELKDSIREQGIIQPITVRRVRDGMYELISGERRVRASTEIGLKSIPAYIIEVKSDQEMLELALVENLQREHLNPIEIAISYQRLTNDIGLNAEDIAKKISKDRTTVVNFLRLLKLPQKIQHSLRKGEITTGHARALLGITDETVQIQIFERVIKKDLSVRQVEKLARDYGKIVTHKPFHIGPRTENAAASIEEKIRQIMATKVKINLREGGKGEIIIEFYSNDDLGRLFDLLSTIQQ
ncbi:MAG: ParB/RepB/Spo0J family partition protein [Bacteroidota bacterium]